jgi:hypothetical protein
MKRTMGRVGVALGVAACVVGSCWVAGAKEKKKALLPDYVLAAKTVTVIIDPTAGIPVDDPGAHKTALDDVEKALMEWGRLKLTMDPAQADLVIVVRKGSDKAVQPTVTGYPTNDRPIIVQQTNDSIRIGAQSGPPVGVPPDQQGNVGQGREVGNSKDSFMVYQGQVGQSTNPTADQTPVWSYADQTPVWRYVEKDGLKAPEVRAVAEFKKAVDEAVKAQQARQKQQGQTTQAASKP